MVRPIRVQFPLRRKQLRGNHSWGSGNSASASSASARGRRQLVGLGLGRRFHFFGVRGELISGRKSFVGECSYRNACLSRIVDLLIFFRLFRLLHVGKRFFVFVLGKLKKLARTNRQYAGVKAGGEIAVLAVGKGN